MREQPIAIFLLLCGCGVSTGDDEDTSAADLTTPVINSVRTDDGFRQVRQEAHVSLVIRGHGLDQTTGITVPATFSAVLDSVTEREVHATIDTDGSAPGLLDVTLTSPAGDATKVGALRLTPFVVSPTATTGHGTFESPMNLCDPDLELAPGLIELQAGVHTCGRLIFLNAGVTLQGDRQAPTILMGTPDGVLSFQIAFGLDSSTTTVQDVTFAPPLFFESVGVLTGNLAVDRVNDAGGLHVYSDGTAAVDRYHYDGPGTGVTIALGTVTRSTFRHCDTGVIATSTANGFNTVTVTGTTVEGCGTGLVSAGGGLEVHDARLIDNGIGVAILSDGQSFHSVLCSVEDSVIRDDASTPTTPRIGIAQSGEELTVNRVKITGEATGVAFGQNNSTDQAGFHGDSLEIVGGDFGVTTFGIENLFEIHNSTIRNQRQASVSIRGVDSFFDLSNNTLSARHGGYAIINNKQFDNIFTRYVVATGTTLNGTSFTGSILEGPLDLPPFIKIEDGDSGYLF